MSENNTTKTVITLADGTKVLQTFQVLNLPGNKKQIQSGQPRTAEQIQKQIDALQKDLQLLHDAK